MEADILVALQWHWGRPFTWLSIDAEAVFHLVVSSESIYIRHQQDRTGKALQCSDAGLNQL